ncbi:hypothetical protein AB1Y20_016531 [Prymnesium parvum]|uniref:Uncharacterized protein n=1 Tax=Prymnesium parvum TaxID=97485 RepID=A0AB34IDS6_PRYPA
MRYACCFTSKTDVAACPMNRDVTAAYLYCPGCDTIDPMYARGCVECWEALSAKASAFAKKHEGELAVVEHLVFSAFLSAAWREDAAPSPALRRRGEGRPGGAWSASCPCCVDMMFEKRVSMECVARKPPEELRCEQMVVESPVCGVEGGLDRVMRHSVEVRVFKQIISSSVVEASFKYRYPSAATVSLFHDPPPHQPHADTNGMNGALEGERDPTPHTSQELLRAIRYGHTARRVHGGVLDVNLLRRAGKKRKKQAPAGHDAVFRAHRAGGAFGHATGTLHHMRQVQAGHRCDVNLPRLPGCYVCLPLCLRSDTRLVVKLLPVYMSRTMRDAIAYGAGANPPCVSADVARADLQQLMETAGASRDPECYTPGRGRTNAIDMLERITKAKIDLCCLMEQLASLRPEFRASLEEVECTLKKWKYACDPDFAPGYTPRITRNGAQLEKRSSEKGSSSTVGIASHGLSRFSRQHHATIIGTSGGHLDTMGVGVEDKVVLVSCTSQSIKISLPADGQCTPPPATSLVFPCYGIATLLSSPWKAGDGDVEVSACTKSSCWHGTVPPGVDEPYLWMRGAWVRSSGGCYPGMSLCDHPARSGAS